MDRKIEISKEEFIGSKRSMHGNNYTNLLQALKGERLSSAFSPNGTLISASRSSLLFGKDLGGKSEGR